MAEMLINEIEKTEYISLRNQIKYMESDRFNDTLEKIEGTLNSLYNKTREIESSTEEIKRWSESLSERRTSDYFQAYRQLKNMDRGQLCFFTESPDFILDRDGQPIDEARMDRDGMHLSSNKMANIIPAGRATTGKGEHINLEYFMNNGHEDHHIEMSPIDEGVYYAYNINFYSAQDIDFIDINPFRCKVEEIEYKCSNSKNNETVSGERLKNKHIRKKSVKSIRIIVNSKYYQRIEGYLDRYLYIYGIKNITIKRDNPSRVCGHISEEMSIKQGYSIELSADYNMGDGDIEFYVIERGREYPIIPVQQSKIYKEKAFSSLDSRFYYYEDFDKKNGYISYTPVPESYQHTVKSGSIKIKVIIRDMGEIPPYIENIFLSILKIQYGEEHISTDAIRTRHEIETIEYEPPTYEGPPEPPPDDDEPDEPPDECELEVPDWYATILEKGKIDGGEFGQEREYFDLHQGCEDGECEICNIEMPQWLERGKVNSGKFTEPAPEHGPPENYEEVLEVPEWIEDGVDEIDAGGF